MRDLERRLHEVYRSEKLDQQIIMGEANLEMYNRALSRPTWAAEARGGNGVALNARRRRRGRGAVSTNP